MGRVYSENELIKSCRDGFKNRSVRLVKVVRVFACKIICKLVIYSEVRLQNIYNVQFLTYI